MILSGYGINSTEMGFALVKRECELSNAVMSICGIWMSQAKRTYIMIHILCSAIPALLEEEKEKW